MPPGVRQGKVGGFRPADGPALRCYHKATEVAAYLLESEQVATAVKDTQVKVERYYYELRKGLFDFDEVLAAHCSGLVARTALFESSRHDQARAEAMLMCATALHSTLDDARSTALGVLRARDAHLGPAVVLLAEEAGAIGGSLPGRADPDESPGDRVEEDACSSHFGRAPGSASEGAAAAVLSSGERWEATRKAERHDCGSLSAGYAEVSQQPTQLLLTLQPLAACSASALSFSVGPGPGGSGGGVGALRGASRRGAFVRFRCVANSRPGTLSTACRLEAARPITRSMVVARGTLPSYYPLVTLPPEIAFRTPSAPRCREFTAHIIFL